VELVRTDFSSGSLGIHELPANTKPFARKRVDLSDFTDNMLHEHPYKSVSMWGGVRVTGDHVNISFSAATGEVSITGTYGV